MRELMQQIKAEIAKWDGVSFHVEARSSHPRLQLTFNGASRFVVLSSTPGDKRGIKNKVRDVRHELARMGARRNV